MQIPVNIPNALSLYRLFSFPIVLFVALYGEETIFVTLLVTNLITDILDGLIARRFNLQTEIGSKIDSTADLGTYILAILGIFLFKLDDFKPHLLSFSIFLGLFLASNVIAFIKFKQLPAYHLYSWKIGGYIQGGFFFVLFVYGFNTWYYYFMAIWGIASFIEHIAIQFILNSVKPNAKGLYWVLKNQQK